MKLGLYTTDGLDIYAGAAGVYIKKIAAATYDMNRHIPSVLKSTTAEHFA